MSEKVNRVMRKALKAVTASIREIAEEAGVHPVTLARHAAGTMGVSPEIALKVARVLRRRGKRLQKLADELEASVGSQKPKRGRRA